MVRGIDLSPATRPPQRSAQTSRGARPSARSPDGRASTSRAKTDRSGGGEQRRQEDERAAAAFAVLGIESSATLPDIRSAYRRAALETHPDKADGSDAFQHIHDAYETLVALATQRSKERAEERRIACEQAYVLWKAKRDAEKQVSQRDAAKQEALSQRPALSQRSSFTSAKAEGWERAQYLPPSRSTSSFRPALVSARHEKGVDEVPRATADATTLPPPLLALEC